MWQEPLRPKFDFLSQALTYGQRCKHFVLNAFIHPTLILMITVSVGFCNPISQNFYDDVINSLQFHQLTCSCGHSGCLTIHGYYDRSVKVGDSDIQLHVCRVICSQCGRTHAVFEDAAIEAVLNAADGTPCVINKLCSASLLIGNSSNLNIINANAVMQAINDCELG